MVGSTAAVQQQLLQPGVLVSKHVGTGDGSYGEVTEDVSSSSSTAHTHLLPSCCF
jgi:hypothetical protein